MADFGFAAQLIAHALGKLLARRFLRLSLPPRLLIQPFGASQRPAQMEERILLELGLSCGAHNVRLHIGAELDVGAIQEKFDT
ncbi:hypothetical protein TMS3_0101740 [Pseudomonas taeanensis MS-3]|uniref:Uncharacterized protein n=1 Tax=Pseudomonas taeanensis MS-3 TaxID=1395571 RepID=A0A0A1YL83_9PSED|nr:hypothetical protein TMS3_0101740 [Pseudomonas taeanensis MS-3]